MNVQEAADAAASPPPVGIDLGTTYSVVAHLDAAGRPVTVVNGVGDLLTPSALFVEDDGVVVGKEAVKSRTLAPDRYIDCFKRDMGAAAARHKLCGFDVPPEILSALVLERLKQDAQRRLGPIRQAVITVPAFFDETRRKATQDAGRLVQLEVLDIINEPTAAALAYGYQQNRLGRDAADKVPSPCGRGQGEGALSQCVLVYDLGGGTFDVTILEIEGTRFRTLATDGDVFLGGHDFDERLVNYLAERFLEIHGVDPRSDPQDAAQLWFDAQEAKHTLSERSKATAVLFHAGIRMRVEITCQQFEDLTRDLLERTETTASLVVKQAGLNWRQIDRVLLVGGSGRMPMVGRMLRKVTGKEPDCSLSPDEVVAHGAALYANMLAGRAVSGQAACQLVNVNSHSLGVVAVHPRTKLKTNVVLIPRNTALPCRAVRTFQTARADQRSVKVSIVEGESERPEACIALGDCVVRDLPAGLPKSTPVEVEYAYHANGRIAVGARVPSVRYSQRIELQRDTARNLGDLEQWRARLCGGKGDRDLLPERPSGCFAQKVPVPFSAEPAPPGALDRLDTLYRAVGRTAVNLPLPDALLRSQRIAVAAADDLSLAQANLKKAAAARQASSDSREAIRLDALLAQAKSEVQRAQSQADFACLVLGRDCVLSGFEPPECRQLIAEIRRLQH
jgi:molecular chaperone DnaK